MNWSLYTISITGTFVSKKLQMRWKWGMMQSLDESAVVLYFCKLCTNYKNNSYLYTVFNHDTCIKLRHMNYSLPLVWNESAAGNQYNLKKLEESHFTHKAVSDGDCNVYQGLGSSAMFTWMFTLFWHDRPITKVVYKSELQTCQPLNPRMWDIQLWNEGHQNDMHSKTQ